MNKRFLALLLYAGVLSALAGCTTEKQSQALSYGEKPAGYKFAKIKDAQVTLEFVGPKYLKAGSSGKVFFTLKNLGRKTLHIEEWRMNEADNLLIECQVWLPGQKEPDPDRWLSMDLPVKQPERRYDLNLYPGNEVRIEKKLDFVESLVVTPGAERRYFIRAALNLTSLRCASPVAALAVTAEE